jgi:hypothetical protein
MNRETRQRRRLLIDRLELDVRGVAPMTAEAAARALGPALARALGADAGRAAPARRIDAGTISTDAATDAPELGRAIAERIAHSVRGPRS